MSKFSKRMKFLLSIVVASLIAMVAMQMTPQPAFAAKCISGWKIKNCKTVTGNWPSGEESSCLAVMTAVYYDFRIDNATGNTIYYQVNGERFSLSDGYGRNHHLPKAIGSNSCNVQSYPTPTVTFDYSYSEGYQKRAYSIGNYTQFVFRQAADGLDLYLR